MYFFVGKVWTTFSEIVKSHRAMLIAACLSARCLEAMCNASPESTMGEALSKAEMEQMVTQPFRPELEKEWPYQV